LHHLRLHNIALPDAIGNIQNIPARTTRERI
jgi:hypothetical protein